MKVNLGNAWLKLGASVTTYLISTSAFADLASFAGTTSTQMHSGMQLLSTGAYCGAGATAIGGVLKLKAHADNPGQTGIGPGLGRIGCAAGLGMAPTLLGMAMGTVGSTSAPQIATF